jgi:hypothetical protein
MTALLSCLWSSFARWSRPGGPPFRLNREELAPLGGLRHTHASILATARARVSGTPCRQRPFATRTWPTTGARGRRGSGGSPRRCGIEVRLDWWLDNANGNNALNVELSWDGGASWTPAKTTTTEPTSEATSVLGAADDNWGRGWSDRPLGPELPRAGHVRKRFPGQRPELLSRLASGARDIRAVAFGGAEPVRLRSREPVRPSVSPGCRVGRHAGLSDVGPSRNGSFFGLSVSRRRMRAVGTDGKLGLWRAVGRRLCSAASPSRCARSTRSDASLAGYAEYAARVRFRIVPRVW